MWNSCENWTINQPALPTSSGLKRSCCSKCECNVILVDSFHLFSFFQNLAQGIQFVWEEGAPKLSPPSPLALPMGMLFWTLHECVINRKTWYNLLKSKLIHVCTFLNLNWYMCAIRICIPLCLTYCAILLLFICSILVIVFSPFIFTIACPTVAIQSLFSIRHFAVDTCTPKRTYFYISMLGNHFLSIRKLKTDCVIFIYRILFNLHWYFLPNE